MTSQLDGQAPDLLDRWGLSLLLFLSAFSLGGMVLASVGRFTLAMVALWGGASWLLAFLGGGGLRASVALGREASFGFLGVILLSALAFFPGGEFILGGWDAGLYYTTGLDLARHGSFIFSDPYAFQGLPGFSEAFIAPSPGTQPSLLPGYIVAAQGEIHPQFPMLLSLWVGASALLGGGRVALLLAPLVGVLSIAFWWLLVRRVLDARAASLAAVFLAFNGVQIWHARQSLSEELVQVMLFGGIWAGMGYLDRREWPYGLAAGLSLGILPLVKTEAMVISLMVVGAFVFLAWRSPSHDGHGSALFSYAGALLLSLVHYATTARFYLWDQLLAGAAAYALLAMVLLGVGGLAAVAQSKHWNLSRLLLPLLPWGRGKVLLLMLTLLFAWTGAAIVAGNPFAPLELARALWLGSFLSLWEVAFLGGGAFWLTRRRSWAVKIALAGPLLWALGLGSLLYLAIYLRYVLAQETLPTFMWATRRLVPLIVPGLALAEAGLVLALAQAWPGRRTALLPVLLAVGLLATRLPDTLPIFLHREYEGAMAQIQTVAQDVEPEAVVLFEADEVGIRLSAPLRSLYGFPTYIFWHPQQNGLGIESLVGAAQAEGRTIYYAATTPGPGAAGLASYQMSFVREYSLRLPELERVSGRRPAQVYPFAAALALFRVGQSQSRPEATLPVLLDVGQEESFSVYTLLSRGFYGGEVMPDGTTYRWTREHALLLLPEGDGEDLLLRLRLAGERPEKLGPARVVVFCQGQEVARFSAGASFAVYSFVVPALCGTEPRQALRLEIDGWSPKELGLSADGRVLGVKLDWIEIRRTSGGVS